MKKVLIVSSIVILVLVSLGAAGFVYAQTPTPATPNYPFGSGMMGGRGMMGGWRQSGVQGSYGPMHQYMVEAWAEAFDMSAEDLQARLEEGDTMWTIAQEKGLTQDEFYKLMTDVRKQAMQKAVEAGVITQEQADWMLNRMGGMWGGGFGSCHGGAFGTGRGPGMRWNTQPPQPAG